MNLTEKEKEIIVFLAKEGEKTDYDLTSPTRNKIASRSTSHYALKKLQRLKLVKVVRIEPFPKIKDRPKKYYGVTFRGVIAALQTNKLKLHQVKRFRKLIALWLKTSYELAKNVTAERKFSFPIDYGKYPELKKRVLGYVKNRPREIEEFLRHFDLDFSSNLLIFQELYLHTVIYSQVFQLFNKKTQKRVRKALKKLQLPLAV